MMQRCSAGSRRRPESSWLFCDLKAAGEGPWNPGLAPQTAHNDVLGLDGSKAPRGLPGPGLDLSHPLLPGGPAARAFTEQ